MKLKDALDSESEMEDSIQLHHQTRPTNNRMRPEGNFFIHNPYLMIVILIEKENIFFLYIYI